MNAALFYGPNNIKMENVSLPNNTRENILLKVLACSICSYDVRTYRNGGFKVKPPIILGHEVCAVTLGDIDRHFTNVKPNSRVSIYPVIPCMKCWYCENQKFNMCNNLMEIGSSLNGGFAEYISVPRILFEIGGVVPVPDNVRNEEAALIEPLACCINGINQIKQMEFGSAVILGDGPIGLMQLMLFKKYFPGLRVTVCGKVRNRLDLAGRIGADEVVLINDNDKPENEPILNKIKNNYSPNMIFVSNNSPNSVDLALTLANKNGKIVFFSGIKKSPGKKTSSNIIDANHIHYNQISIYGSFSSTPNEMREAMRLVSTREIDLQKLVTNTYSLFDLEKAILASEKFQGLKSLVNSF